MKGDMITLYKYIHGMNTKERGGTEKRATKWVYING